jgi:hypothetical protein
MKVMPNGIFLEIVTEMCDVKYFTHRFSPQTLLYESKLSQQIETPLVVNEEHSCPFGQPVLSEHVIACDPIRNVFRPLQRANRMISGTGSASCKL